MVVVRVTGGWCRISELGNIGINSKCLSLPGNIRRGLRIIQDAIEIFPVRLISVQMLLATPAPQNSKWHGCRDPCFVRICFCFVQLTAWNCQFPNCAGSFCFVEMKKTWSEGLKIRQRWGYFFGVKQSIDIFLSGTNL